MQMFSFGSLTKFRDSLLEKTLCVHFSNYTRGERVLK